MPKVSLLLPLFMPYNTINMENLRVGILLRPELTIGRFETDRCYRGWAWLGTPSLCITVLFTHACEYRKGHRSRTSRTSRTIA